MDRILNTEDSADTVLVCANLLELYDLISSRNFGFVIGYSDKLIPFSKANEEVIYVSRDSF